MEVSSLTSFGAAPERRKAVDPAAPGTAFQQELQRVQNGSEAAPVQTGLLAGRFNHNGQDVSFDELPPEVQDLFRTVEEKSTRDEAYRAQVANDPNIGPLAKLRPFDPAIDGWAMKRLAAMEASTAHMTPEQYYNYAGSDREKYDTLIAKAESPPPASTKRAFAADPEQESKVGLIRDLRAQGQPLPATYAEFEQRWLSDIVRQQALAQERQHSLGTGQQLDG